MPDVERIAAELRAIIDHDASLGLKPPLHAEIRALLDELARQGEALKLAREVIAPFALLVEQQDASDWAFILREGGDESDMAHYAPDNAKVHSSGELRNALYLTKGDFRKLAKFYRAFLSTLEGSNGS
ncbi:hypothetical protein [Mesorhizobium sp. M4B.F.Ca.ET.143.01.1.1]|uniref:hypothetical protein n=1 Tax=Mesorhizobium sp. M4B.F.Ca.ET.143.01.1.1 TaxID=2563947 RepID=UPI001093BA2A|nr:hypothetical protein [Mesorhizobium sp. M4B.F.Ca.ET.143.01.1.1]TGV26374.1 hypothetical protein EN786_12700 [Mesorhizobium sp. M4B.F.Ca.ET.143.01.1.1]